MPSFHRGGPLLVFSAPAPLRKLGIIFTVRSDMFEHV
jgi:hypothetical protein